MISVSKFFIFCLVSLMVACLVLSGCDERKKEDIEKKYKTVLWADKIDTLDWVDGLKSLFNEDVFDWLKEQLIEVMDSLPQKLIEDLGDDPVSIILNLVESEGQMDLGVGLILVGGIATYNCEACTNNCCFYSCGQFLPCFNCSKSKCGQSCIPLPNNHQPYIAIGKV
eukprot:TRINITY_DN3557_c1_g3_i6.p3 TRINITY_DN3557_c1_g3~~TRINITY_DN3557_c1_g3_i6.p3  ORF type:complete len:168 (-),score=18.60 TRINITY_DN3557_c1_g3_i6:391-894(-)